MFRTLRPSQQITDAVLATLFALCALVLEWGIAAGDSRGLAPILVVILLMAAALAVRRLSPGLSLGIAWLGALVQMAAQLPPGPTDIAIFGVLYVTAAYGSRRVFWAGLVSTGVGAMVITLYLFVPVVMGGEPLNADIVTVAFAVLLAALFGLGLSWTIGALVRTGIRARATQAAQRLAEAETAAEQERVRIARDMHDVVAHSLAVVIAQADGARYAGDPAGSQQALATISTTARSALSDVRMLLTQLRHSQGDGPQPTLADLEGLYAQVRAAGVELRVDVDPTPAAIPPAAVQLGVYRILQEALTNALRHGAGADHGGGRVDVTLAWHAERVELTVRNPLRQTPAEPSRGHGLVGMRERAQLIGGTLTADARDGFFVVRATLPIAPASEAQEAPA